MSTHTFICPECLQRLYIFTWHLCLFYSNSSPIKFASQLISSKLFEPINCSWIRRTHPMLCMTLISWCVCCIFSLGEKNVLTVLYFQRIIYTNMGIVKREFCSALWKVDIFLNSFHCLYPNLRVTDLCCSFGKTPMLLHNAVSISWFGCWSPSAP